MSVVGSLVVYVAILWVGWLLMFVGVGVFSYIRFRLGYFDEEEYDNAEWNRWYEYQQQRNDEQWWYYGRIDYYGHGQSSEERYDVEDHQSNAEYHRLRPGWFMELWPLGGLGDWETAQMKNGKNGEDLKQIGSPTRSGSHNRTTLKMLRLRSTCIVPLQW